MRKVFSTLSGRVAASLAALAIITAATFAVARAQTAAGTTISNRARINYAEPDGGEVETLTNVVTVRVEIVNGVTVTPDETAPSGSVETQGRVAVSFSVCNSGNNALPFLIGSATVTAPASVEGVYLDADGSGSLTNGDTPVSLGVTKTPGLAPGSCSPVVVLYAVNGAAPFSEIAATLGAHSPDDAEGQRVEDAGTVLRTVKRGPDITDPEDPKLPPRKTVNGVEQVTASQNQAVDFQIAFRNSGESTALAVVVADDIPRGLSFVPGSLRLVVGDVATQLTEARDGDGGEVVGQALAVRLASLPPGEIVSVRFRARVEPLPGGTLLINRASVSADNAALVHSREARVLVSPLGVVFDGETGGASPVPSASVRFLSEGRELVELPAGGFVPNGDNVNPFLTGADGAYCFRLAEQLRASSFNLVVVAEGYKPRLVALNVSPQSGQRFGVTLSALDGQPLAVAGGYALTRDAVSIDGLGALAANIPLFPSGALEVSKSVDRPSALVGDVISYRVEARNSGRTPARNVELRDTLPQGFYYAPGTALVSLGGTRRNVEPEIAGDTLTFRFAEIPAGATLTLVYRVRIGVNAQTGEQYNVVVGRVGDNTTPPARVPVLVRSGLFGTTQFLVGRVFVDENRDGEFDAGDKPLAGARLFTSTGLSVITDSAGNYNLPLLPDGSLVVQLDSSSVPGFAPRDGLRLDGSTWSRLVRTPLQGGAMLTAGFALEPVDTPAARAADAPTVAAGQGRDGAEPRGGPGSAPLSISTPAPLPSPAPAAVAVTPQKKRGNIIKRFFGAIFGKGPGRPSEARASAPRPPSRETKKRTDDRHAKRTALPTPTPLVIYSASGEVISTELPAQPPNAQDTAQVAPAATPAPTPFDAPHLPGEVGGHGSGSGFVREDPAPPAASFAPAPAAVPATPAPSPSPQIIPAAFTPPSTAAPASDPGAPDAPAPPAHAGLVKVEPGAVVLDLQPNAVLLAPALDVPVRYPLGWASRLYLNGVLVDPNRVGETVTDRSSETEQVTYVGLPLAPGPNQLRAVSVSPDGVEGAPREVVVYGRGPAVRYSVEPASAEVPSGRRSGTEVVVRAWDAWGNPAQDGELVLSTSLGSLGERPAALGEQAARQLGEREAQSTVEFVKDTSLRLVGGVARAQLVAPDSPGTARLVAAGGSAGGVAEVVFRAEGDAPRMLVGHANLTFGRAAPSMILRGVNEDVRGSLQFFYRGRLFGGNVLTLAYDSQRPLQRLDARDRLFQLDPLEYSYQTFGDDSTRFNAAPSNSKLYARLDFSRRLGRSYALFGDFTPEHRYTELSAYSRQLTGAQLHLEGSKGSFISVGVARPSTSFARDVFPGGSFGLVRLSASLVVPGSEVVTVETRDRRNPDLIVTREQLVRGADYNLDSELGQIFFIRPIQAFDPDFNLRQVVVTYEYEAAGASSNVYTLRASRTFGDGGRFGLSFAYQGQASGGHYTLGGMDLSQEMPNGGVLRMEASTTIGNLAGSGSFFGGDTARRRDGIALLAYYDQPLRWRASRLQLSYRSATADFFNPFGASVIGGTSRAGFSFETQATRTARLRMGLTHERTETDAVKNERQTAGLTWTQSFGDRFSGTLAYDFRRLKEDGADGDGRTINSHMVTAGIDWRPNDRLTFSARREQNLAEADPTYPNQTVFTGSYKLNDYSRLFFSQRLSSAPITPINDLTGAGFAFSNSRREFTAGVETKLLRDTSLTGGYRIEQGETGSDSFAIVGLTQRWKLNEQFALDAGFERAFHVRGEGGTGSYNSLTSGLTWQPRESFVSNARYEYRDREGRGHLFAAGFAGKPFDSVTALGRFQWSRSSLDGQARRGVYGSFGVALRPAESDRQGVFFNYQYRGLDQGFAGVRTVESRHTLSADAFRRVSPRFTLFGKAALSAQNTSSAELAAAPNFTYLLQARAEYLLTRRFDVAAEGRWLAQPSTSTARYGGAAEVGYWLSPDIRAGIGYNYFRPVEQPGRSLLDGGRRGFYFSLSTKLERLFDFMGAKKKGAEEKTQ